MLSRRARLSIALVLTNCLAPAWLAPLPNIFPARAQETVKNADGSTTKTEKYSNGNIKSQETTKYGPDGKTVTGTVKTDYDEDGRPTSEIERVYKQNEVQTLEKTWVYDGQGRLTFFSYENTTRSTESKPMVPGITQKYRRRIKYSDDKDKTGKITEEEYSSVDGKWRTIEEGDQVTFGNPEKLMEPAQKLPSSTKKTETGSKEKPSPSPDSGNPPGARTETKINAGLQIISFNTPQGRINLNLTDDLAAGDTVSGTVEEEPSGGTDAQRTQNISELNGYLVEVGREQTPVVERILTRNLPRTLTPVDKIVRLLHDGNEVGRSEVFISSEPAAVTTVFVLPGGGQQGRPIEIKGPFDGKISDADSVKIGGRAIPILAESPRKIIARNASDVTGQTNIECNENGIRSECPFRNLAVRLSAPKLTLRRDETTTLHIAVLGLTGIAEDVPLGLSNNSPAVVALSGGNSQRLDITHSEVKDDGSYVADRTLTGITPGSFSITATVSWSNFCRNDVSAFAPPRPKIPRKAPQPKIYDVAVTGSGSRRETFNGNCDGKEVTIGYSNVEQTTIVLPKNIGPCPLEIYSVGVDEREIPNTTLRLSLASRLRSILPLVKASVSLLSARSLPKASAVSKLITTPRIQLPSIPTRRLEAHWRENAMAR